MPLGPAVLFNGVTCELFCSLVGLSVGKGSSEQGGHSLSSFTRSYCTRTKVSRANCEALKLVSLRTQRPNLFHYVNQMQWVVHKCWLLSAGLFCLLVVKGEMGQSLVCSPDLCLSKMDLILCTMNSLTLICNFQKVWN